MTKKILTILLALAMLTATACTSENSSEPTNNSSASDSSYIDSSSENSSESTPDSSSDSESENTTTTSETTTTTTTTTSATTTTKNSTTTTTTTQATTTTKNTTKTTQKPVVQTTTTKYVAPAPKNTTTTTAKKTTTTTKAAQPAVNTSTYVNNIIADINKMFPESQFNRTLYDKFERLCKGIPTEQDKKDISAALCSFAIRKFNGKTGTFTCYYQINPTPATWTVTAKQTINIKMNSTFTRDNAHLNVGNDTSLYYAAYKNTEQNYQGINTFIRECYSTMDSGMWALIKKNVVSHTEIYYSIDCAGYQSGVNHNAYYMWFCHKG